MLARSPCHTPPTTAHTPVWLRFRFRCSAVFGELLTGRPILPGSSEPEQLQLTLKLCGSPTAESWPKHETLPYWVILAKPFLKGRVLERRTKEKFRGR